VEDRELVGLVLAGRDPLGNGGVGLAAAEEAFEHRVSEGLGVVVIVPQVVRPAMSIG
jgi:hypothetical protein